MSDQVAEVGPKYLAQSAAAAKSVVPEGYKLTEVGVIPEDWEVYRLCEVAEIRSGIAKNSASVVADPIAVNYLSVANVQDGYLDLSIVNRIVINRKDLKRYSVLPGDVLMNEGGDLDKLGRGALWSGELNYCVHQNHVFVVRASEKIDPIFLNVWTSGNAARRFFQVTGKQTTNLASISKSGLSLLPIALANRKEQTAIANALSDVDALLNEMEKLIAKKQAIKTATMQQLLTGRIRLPQFANHPDGSPKGYKPSELGEIPEDWRVRPLRELLIEKPKYGINAPAVPLIGKRPVYIRITDISDDGYFRPSNKVGINSPLSQCYELSEGDIVMARTGASVGKSYLYRKEDGELVYAGFLIKVSPNPDALDSCFLWQYMKTERYWNWVAVNSMRSGQPGINGNEYGCLLVACPAITEQTAIATILSDMDEEVQALEQRLAKTRQIKQGMMQELLTGKTRLI